MFPKLKKYLKPLVIAVIIVALWQMFQSSEGFGNSKTLMLFHMEGCGHCKRLMPVWNQLKSKYSGLDDVEYTRNKEMANRYGVTGFPTILLLSNGNVLKKYDGDRSIEDLSSFIEANMQ